MKPKLNVCLLLSFIIGLAYIIFLFSYFVGTNTSATSGSEVIGYGIAMALVMPHMVCTLIAVVFNGLGVFTRKAVFALVGAILYAVAMILFPLYFLFVLIETILSFVAYAQMRRVANRPDPEPRQPSGSHFAR